MLAARLPAAVKERLVAGDLLRTGPPPRDLLADKGFNGKAFAAARQPAAPRSSSPTKNQRAAIPPIVLTIIAQ